MTDTTRPTVITGDETTSTATATKPARPAFTAGPDELPQYSRGRILKIWAAAALPMAALAWVGAPLLAGAFDGPSAWPRAIVVSLTAGLVWQFVLVLLLVHREQGSLRWSVMKEALWLRAPQSPRTGRRGGLLWLLVIALILAVAAKEELPKLPAPTDRDLGLFLQSGAGHEFFAGNWPWFTLILTMMIFNTVLGEELLFAACSSRGCAGRSAAGTGSPTACCSGSTTCTCPGASRRISSTR
jgi:hypothetical protein